MNLVKLYRERYKSYSVKQKRRNNRSLQKNRKKYGINIRRKRYKIQSGDLLEKNGKIKKSKGTTNHGRYAYIIDDEKDYWKTENVKIIKYGKGLFFN